MVELTISLDNMTHERRREIGLKVFNFNTDSFEVTYDGAKVVLIARFKHRWDANKCCEYLHNEGLDWKTHIE